MKEQDCKDFDLSIGSSFDVISVDEVICAVYTLRLSSCAKSAP